MQSQITLILMAMVSSMAGGALLQRMWISPEDYDRLTEEYGIWAVNKALQSVTPSQGVAAVEEAARKSWFEYSRVMVYAPPKEVKTSNPKKTNKTKEHGMSNGKSRSKGVRGERDIRKRLGGKRVGVAYLKNPVDIDLGWAVLQIKNHSQGGSAIHDALKAMESVTEPNIDKYMIFKSRRGQWIVCEFLEQFEANHGAKLGEDTLGDGK